MTNKQILEDYKEEILFPEFAAFYCKELYKYIIPRLPVKDEEKQVELSKFEKNDLPPDGHSISVKPTVAVVKRQISKKIDKPEIVVVRADTATFDIKFFCIFSSSSFLFRSSVSIKSLVFSLSLY
jgi:hypothetical protein